MELLACCARGEMEPGYRERARALLRSELDWPGLTVLADRHKLLPLLWWHLRRESAAVPEANAVALQRSFSRNAARMLQLSGELLALTRLLGDRGIPAVPYKGPVLGAYLYDNLALRQAGDLDLLVRRGDVGRARALLLERGYRPRHALARGGKEFMVRSRYSEVLDRDDGSTVELHWAFTNGDIALPLDLDALAPHLRTLPFGGGSVAIFGDEDLLLILCVHGSKHRWDRLEWLCGVAELLRRRTAELDWDAVVSRAASLGVRRMVLLGALLAHDLLDAPVPGQVLELARADGPVSSLAAEVPELFLTDAVDAEAGGNLATDSFRLRLRERPRDRLRFIWYRITTPSRPESWRALPIGKYALPLHGFVRPFGLAPKLIPALRGYVLRVRRFSRPSRS